MRKKVLAFVLIVLILLAVSACLPSENGDESGNGDGETPSQQKTYNLSDPLITISVKDRFDIVYNGTALECSFDLRYDGRIIDTFTAGSSHPDLAAEFSDNVNAGNAKITLSGTSTKKYTGTVEFTFEILQSKEKKTVSSYSELEKELSLLNFTSFSLSEDISVPENKTLTVPSSAALDLNGHLLTVEGTFINEGRITAESVSDKDFSVVNEGVFVNRHSLSLKFGTAFYNCGELRNEGTFDSASSKGVFSDVAMVGMDEYDFVYRRINMTECEGSLSYVSAEYDGKAKEPAYLRRKTVVLKRLRNILLRQRERRYRYGKRDVRTSFRSAVRAPGIHFRNNSLFHNRAFDVPSYRNGLERQLFLRYLERVGFDKRRVYRAVLDDGGAERFLYQQRHADDKRLPGRKRRFL